MRIDQGLNWINCKIVLLNNFVKTISDLFILDPQIMSASQYWGYVLQMLRSVFSHVQQKPVSLKNESISKPLYKNFTNTFKKNNNLVMHF